jgi:hypothetical protein
MSFGYYVPGGAGWRDFPPEAMQYATQVGGKLDVITAPIWSTENLASGTQELVWFSTVYQDKVNGNLQSQGIMPANYAFLVRAIRLVPLTKFYFETAIDATNLLADLAALLTRSYVTIRIGPKDFGDFPSHMLPAGSGLHWWSTTSYGGFASATENLILDINNGVPDASNVYVLSKPLLIEALQPFSVRLRTVQGGITWTGTGVTNITLQFIMDGDFYRPVA